MAAVTANAADWTLVSLPRALNPEEVELLLDSFSANVRLPKRGYAIVRCALDLGLRSCEIAHLMLDDINWRAGTVVLKGTKSRRQDLLPLPMTTGQALADYLQHERPTSKNPGGFVRRRPPYDQPISATAIQKVICRAYRRAGLPHSGSHALRHTLACRLVENGSSLKEVADVLRHRKSQNPQDDGKSTHVRYAPWYAVRTVVRTPVRTSGPKSAVRTLVRSSQAGSHLRPKRPGAPRRCEATTRRKKAAQAKGV